jgi:hypothetical protein
MVDPSGERFVPARLSQTAAHVASSVDDDSWQEIVWDAPRATRRHLSGVSVAPALDPPPPPSERLYEAGGAATVEYGYLQGIRPVHIGRAFFEVRLSLDGRLMRIYSRFRRFSGPTLRYANVDWTCRVGCGSDTASPRDGTYRGSTRLKTNGDFTFRLWWDYSPTGKHGGRVRTFRADYETEAQCRARIRPSRCYFPK